MTPPQSQLGRDDANAAWSIPGTLISGLLVWGGVGWLIDRLTGLSVFMPIGLFVGMGAALALVYARYGRAANTEPTKAAPAPSARDARPGPHEEARP